MVAKIVCTMMSYFICCVLLLNSFNAYCEQILEDDKYHIFDSKLQPNEFRYLGKSMAPQLEGKSKGEAGKIGVIGGSIEYTGAPYFAAMTALKVGADLVYVITTETASPVIKAYSPDLIVYPFLNTKLIFQIRSLLPKMHVIIIGPGLGRDTETLKLIYDVIEECKRLGKPLVIDADGLFAISVNPSVLKDYPCPGVILTPNQREADKLLKSVSSNSSHWYTYWGDCVAVLVKGGTDRFYSSTSLYNWSATGGGSGRRAAGQGDILSGALGTFYGWALQTELCNNTQLAQSAASYTAAKFTRLTNEKAYVSLGRSLIASDMIKEIHPAFEVMFSGTEPMLNLSIKIILFIVCFGYHII